ncbi:MAG: class I SAM-dependent methyltransferase [Pseudomonadota bacterium]
MNPLLRRLPPSVIALMLQFAAFMIVILFLRFLGLQPAPIISALLCGALAATFSHFIGLARWWLFIQFLFAPALVLMLALAIPPGFFLAAFLVMLAVYWSTFRTQVPLYLSSDKVWQALETQLPAGQPFSFIDLGSGLGGVLTHLAHTHPQGSYLGVEAAPLPFLWSWLRIRLGGNRNCEVQWGSMWDSDLSKYDVVFAYLSPVPMQALWDKAKKEMRSGSLFISSTFPIPGQSPQKTISVDDLHHSTLHIWQM